LLGLKDKTNGKEALCYDLNADPDLKGTYQEECKTDEPIRERERQSAALLELERLTQALRTTMERWTTALPKERLTI
jgi:hypothetical protein